MKAGENPGTGETAPEPPTIGKVLDRIGAAAISFDADGHPLTISGTIERLLGPDARTVLAEDIAAMRRELTERGDFATERRGPDGRTLRIHAASSHDGGGSLNYVDVTPAGTAPQPGARPSSFHAAVVASATDAIVGIDRGGSIIECNPAAERMFGLTRERMLGYRITDALFAEPVPDLSSKDLVGRTIELRGRCSDGRVFPIEATIAEVPFQDGSAFIAYLSDIGERVRIEREARESGRRLEELVGANPIPMTITRVADGLVVYANQRAADMVRVPIDQVIGSRSMDFYADPNDRDTVVRLLREQGEVELLEVRFRRGDGTTFPLALVCRPIVYAGEPAIVTGFHDLSDWKRMEEALHHSEKLAALGSLLAGVAHELNNPLSIVFGQAILMEELATDPDIVARAGKIRIAAERCTRIVRTFLALARQRQTTPGPTSLNEVVSGAVELLAYPLRTSDVQVTLDLAEGLPDLWADSDQMNQVVTNLIVNAQQALGERPPPRHMVIATAADNERRSIRLTVEDNGPGIDPKIRSRVFEPFFTTKQPGAGTGIGLSMCLSIVSAHGGTIRIEDAPSGGARFIIELPLRDIESSPDEPAPGRARPAPRQCRILVVDDESEVAETLGAMIEADGHRVDIAENGEAALRKLDVGFYEAIVSDLRMPVMDGPGLYREIARRHAALLPYVAFVTGDSLSPDVRRFLDENDVLCLEKPFVRDEVRQLLVRLLPASADQAG